MSSFDPGALSSAENFVPDVDSVGAGTFVPEVVARAAVEPPARHDPTPLDDYDPTPTEEELRAMLQIEMRDELAAEIQRLRGEDAAAFQELAQSIRSAAEERLDTIARRAVELSMAVAERLVRDRIDRDPAVVERALREALASIDAASGVTVHAHPDDATYLRSQTELLSELGVEQVVDDPRQRRGGCLIDVGKAGWDLTVITQLASLQESIDRLLEAS
mgnify:FL=1